MGTYWANNFEMGRKDRVPRKFNQPGGLVGVRRKLKTPKKFVKGPTITIAQTHSQDVGMTDTDSSKIPPPLLLTLYIFTMYYLRLSQSTLSPLI